MRATTNLPVKDGSVCVSTSALPSMPIQLGVRLGAEAYAPAHLDLTATETWRVIRELAHALQEMTERDSAAGCEVALPARAWHVLEVVEASPAR